jgi:negative regulator of sigma E activity
MALARIISRSPQCSRELALDLLGRGYAVEIVSPDAIPDNFADLELRVEADASNILTANVAVHDGEHSASLDFVHHLKAPLVDFVRRPPEAGPAAYFPDSPVSFNAEGLFDQIELPPTVSERALPPANQPFQLLPDLDVGPQLITLPEQVLPPAQESEEEHVRTGITIIIHRSRPKPKQKLKPKPANPTGGWFLRTAVGFAAIVVLAVVLGRGIRGTRTSSIESPKTNAADEANVFAVRAPQPPTVRAAAATPVSGTAEEKRAAAPQQSALKKSASSSSHSRIESSLRKADDLRTPDAAVYRDKPVAQVAKKTGHHRSRRRYQDDVVATDTVTYLD